MPRPYVVFDLGEVLSVAPPHLPELAALAVAADAGAFATAYWRHRLPYDAGTSPTSYWTLVLREVGRAPDAQLIRTLTDLDIDAWTTLADGALELLRDVHAADAGLGLLSNAPEPLARAVREQPWSELFDELVFSAELGLTKPAREIYDAATARFGGDPAAVVFFDDRPANVTGACDAGWQGHLWAGVGDARSVLGEAGLW